jgi:hypothetical protein
MGKPQWKTGILRLPPQEPKGGVAAQNGEPARGELSGGACGAGGMTLRSPARPVKGLAAPAKRTGNALFAKKSLLIARVPGPGSSKPHPRDKAMLNFLPRRTLCAGLVVMGLSASVHAATPAHTGLGQNWPNAQDVSVSPHWHVYVFTAQGIRYVQVNDLRGEVRGVLATANGQFLVLPMGRDAQRIWTAHQRPAMGRGVVALSAYAQTIYRDGAVQLKAIPLSDGTTMFTATAADAPAAATSPCSNPVECNGHVD